MEQFMQIINALVLSFCAYHVAKFIITFLEIRALIQQKTQATLEKMAVPVRFELIDNVYFVWNKTSNEFLGQGRDYQELVANIMVRFKNGIEMQVDPSDEIYKQLKLTRES